MLVVSRAACLASDGHTVFSVNGYPINVQMLFADQSPIFEPGSDRLIEESVKSYKLSANQDFMHVVLNSDVTLICEGSHNIDNVSFETGIRRKSFSGNWPGAVTKRQMKTVVQEVGGSTLR